MKVEEEVAVRRAFLGLDRFPYGVDEILQVLDEQTGSRS
jgi:hypothetical protein